MCQFGHFWESHVSRWLEENDYLWIFPSNSRFQLQSDKKWCPVYSLHQVVQSSENVQLLNFSLNSCQICGFPFGVTEHLLVLGETINYTSNLCDLK